jgi:hypothetical protein
MTDLPMPGIRNRGGKGTTVPPRNPTFSRKIHSFD